MKDRYDLVVIGSGSAGEKGAVQAAYFGRKVAVIEREPVVGGACINTGTIPSKTLRETALYLSGLRQRGLYGIDYSLREGLSIRDFMHRKEVVVQEQIRLIRRNFDRHGVELLTGRAALLDANTVQLTDPEGRERRLLADVILIATGSSPHHPPEVPFDHPRVLDSDSILKLDFLPESMLVVGGGVIGSEYAGIFTALGRTVSLIDGRDRLLPFIDREIADRVSASFSAMGMRLLFNERVESVDPHDDGVRLILGSGASLSADVVLFAAGRQSNVEGLNLDRVGVATGSRGLIQVDEHYRTTVPNIYAAGDVIGFPALASTSMEQARVAMVHAFGLEYKERVSPVLPYAVYSIPEVAVVGKSEDDCRRESIDCLVGRSFYDKSPRGQILGDTAGMLKLVFAPADKRLLGVHMVGELASELVHLGAHVIAEQGTIDAFINAVYNYPTLADSYKYAAYDGLGNLRAWKAKQ